MKKTYHQLGDWRRNTLLVAAAATLGLSVLPACSGNSGSEANQEQWGGGETYSQGVITEMTEMQPGEWRITAERPAGKEEVAAILKHFDGKVDTLQGQALQKQMQDYSRQHPENRVAGTGMMDILMWSGIGYMAGRFMTPNRGVYAKEGLLERNAGWRQNIAREQQQGRSFFGRGFTGNRPSGSRSGIRSTAPQTGRSSGFSGRSGGGFGG